MHAYYFQIITNTSSMKAGAALCSKISTFFFFLKQTKNRIEDSSAESKRLLLYFHRT